MEHAGIALLFETLELAKGKNPSYSIRAFARDAGISPASMSQILTHKRPLTSKTALRIGSNLNFSKNRQKALLSSLAIKRRSNRTQEIDLDTFSLIADWYHYAILALIDVDAKKSKNSEWISKSLGIPKRQAKEALKRMERLGIIKIKETVRQMSLPLVTPGANISSFAIRKHHKQNLERAKLALTSVEPELREFGSMTLSIDPKDLPIIKKMIREFRQQVDKISALGDRRQVYHLCTQFFPANSQLTKEKSSE